MFKWFWTIFSLGTPDIVNTVIEMVVKPSDSFEDVTVHNV